MKNSVWFASWKCNCTIIDAVQRNIALKCPEHGKPLYSRPELVNNINNVPHGISPDYRIKA